MVRGYDIDENISGNVKEVEDSMKSVQGEDEAWNHFVQSV